MNKLLIVILLYLPAQVSAMCNPVDTIIIGDSQTGATWAKSYLGNFLPECLEGHFAFYGRGGTVPAHWMNQSNMDHIETIHRTNLLHHVNLGKTTELPECQKRLKPMLDAHTPRRVIFQFGGNMIYLSDTDATKQIDQLMKEIEGRNVSCYFITPTYEMAVEERRNVPARNLTAIKRINSLIKSAVRDRCKVLDGVELMKNSPYFDGKELLKRVQIPGLIGCAGAAVNDNVHVCGAAARDWSEKVCEVLYSDSY